MISIGDRAARGALWAVVASIAGRIVGVAGTLAMTRFLHPETMGDVSSAAVLSLTAGWLTVWGFGQYAVVKGRGEVAREVRWHATVFYIGLGAIALGLVAAFGGRIVPWFGTPGAAAYVPGLALAIFIRRIGAMPERILTQRMEFRPSAIALAVGETTYTATAIALAAAGWGGMAIVAGNIAQSVVVVSILVRAAGWRSWATPVPLRATRIRDMLAYGIPLGVQGIAHNAARYWDNLVVSCLFGAGALGTYNLAYNLADIPAVQVGEQVALVLLPSMAELPAERRARAFERATALLSLVIFPLAIGLGLVAEPLIALVLPAGDWQDVAPLLVVLACLSIFRPITWTISAYLEAEAKTGRLMFLELVKLALLLAGLVVLSPLGLPLAAGAVGLAYGITAIAGVALVVHEGASRQRMLRAFVQPLAACTAMALAILIARETMLAAGLERPVWRLVVEIGVGGTAYVVAAFVVCRESSRDLLALVRAALRRRRHAD